MAGGGSLLTVGLLNVVVGLPGLVANGTNRVGVLVPNVLSDELPQRRNYRISTIDSGANASYLRFANRFAACL